MVPLIIVVYYLGIQRSVNSPRRNGKLVAALKVLVLVCLGGIATAAIIHAAANPASNAGPPVSIAYVADAPEPKKDSPDTLKQLEGEFMKAAADKGSAGYMSYYADDAVEVSNNSPLIEGKVNIAKDMGFLDDKNNQLIWTPVGADISGSSDLGYTYGTYEFHSKNKDGKLAIEYGKYTSIWKKQKDGSWKVVLDMGNASPEPK
jgi:ketosteroid isomerase-like protein